MTKNSIKQTINAYNKNAEKYAEKFDNYPVYQRKISDFQAKYIANSSHILDLGCGPANNIKTIFKSDQSSLFTGVDLSSEFIDIAKSRFPQFSFKEQDIRKLSLVAKFDVIIASFCIVHLKDEETINFLQRVSELIKKDGHLYLSYMNGNKSGFESTSFSKDDIFFNYYDDQFILNLLKENNFSILEIGKEEYTESDGSITIDTFIYAKMSS